MKLRAGRRNGRTLYLQLGEQPSDDDPCVGFTVDDGIAEVIAEAVTSPWHLNEIKSSAEDRGSDRVDGAGQGDAGDRR